MTDYSPTLSDVLPSAVPTEADLATWDALPRDEQERRLRASLADPACSKVSPDSMDDILKRARAKAGLSHG